MNESDRRQRVISSTPRLSTDEVANHSFAKGVRGFSETEVRAFLKRVSDELVAARGARARARVGDRRARRTGSHARGRCRSRSCSTRSARRRPGSCARRARRATTSARRPRSARHGSSTTPSAAAERTRAEAAELLADAHAPKPRPRPHEMSSRPPKRAPLPRSTRRRRKRRRSSTTRAHQGREMLDEAKSARERVLGDLVRRRALLERADRSVARWSRPSARRVPHGQAHVPRSDRSARAGRGARRGRTIDVERANPSTSRPRSRPRSRSSTPRHGRRRRRDADDAAATTRRGCGRRRVSEHVQLVPPTCRIRPTTDETEVATALADVDSLFARLRAGHDDAGPRRSVTRRRHAASPTTDGRPAITSSIRRGTGSDVREEWRSQRGRRRSIRCCRRC